MNKFVFLLFLLVLTSPHQALCADETAFFELGSEMVNINPPEGFHDISNVLRDVFEYISSSVPPDGEVLAVYLSEKDVKEISKTSKLNLERYFFAQSIRINDNINIYIDTKYFEKLKRMMIKKMKGISGDDDLERRTARVPNQRDLKRSSNQYLGIIDETPRSFSLMILSRFDTDIGDKELTSFVASVSSLCYIRGRVIHLLAYTSYKAQEDLDWIRTASIQWVRDVLAANPNISSGMPKRFHDTVKGKELVASVTAFVIVLLSIVLKWLKKRHPH